MGVISEVESEELCEGLTKIEGEWESGTFALQPSDEDIHTAHERRLTELLPNLGGKLHTGRSRNDQVATDTRLYLARKEKDIVKVRRGSELQNCSST